jgi:DNA-binding Lrp family transcriptional regulator
LWQFLLLTLIFEQDSAMTLDRYDKSILDALQKDGRISNVQLANLVSLSESACLRRVSAPSKSRV